MKTIPFIGYMIHLLFYIELKGGDRKITKKQSIIVDIKYMKEKWNVQAILALETQIQQMFVKITMCQKLYPEYFHLFDLSNILVKTIVYILLTFIDEESRVRQEK